MKLSGECANFEIDSGNITLAADTSIPFVITNKVNMRSVLGDMYNKYKKFYIQLNSLSGFATSAVGYTAISPPTVPSGQTGLVWTLGMSGDLRFLSNTVNGQPSSIGYFGLRFTLPVNGYATTNAPATGYGIVFELPPNESVTINLTPYQVRGGTAAILGVVGVTGIFDFNFNFSIYGLSEE
jgi:hypothetical protein